MAALVVALLAVVVRLGGPQEVVTRAYDQFLQPAPPSGLNQRLFSLSSNGRADLWSVAWSGFEDHRLFGSGPGTYEITWMHERPSVLKVRDAHSLYAESLAELGLAGTALIVLVLLLPLPASIRGRRQSFVPAAAGAYAHLPSMLEDVLHHRPTEVDFIAGALVGEADGHGVPVPVTAALWRLVRGREASWGLEARFPDAVSA